MRTERGKNYGKFNTQYLNLNSVPVIPDSWLKIPNSGIKIAYSGTKI